MWTSTHEYSLPGDAPTIPLWYYSHRGVAAAVGADPAAGWLCQPAPGYHAQAGATAPLPDSTPMYTATFIFRKRQFDDDFHRLDQLIAQAASRTEGYLGTETWEDPVSGRVSNVYYWSSERGLQQLMQDRHHLEAKSRQAEWLAGYRVEIAQVLRRYGDGGVPAPAA